MPANTVTLCSSAKSLFLKSVKLRRISRMMLLSRPIIRHNLSLLPFILNSVNKEESNIDTII